jgi:hypothetical protein
MTPEEKAKYLISINSLAILSVIGNKLPMVEVKEIAKQFTLLEIDEIIDLLSHDINPLVNYWFEVKKEIENYEF